MASERGGVAPAGAEAAARLLAAAREAAERAYAPYSRLRVGAALLAADGRIFSACNVENASFGLSICAERAAVFKAVSEGVRRFAAVAVTLRGLRPVPPCGACCQVLAEFNPAMQVVLPGADGEPFIYTLDQLLTLPFLGPPGEGDPEEGRR